jgi:hypothetical protein
VIVVGNTMGVRKRRRAMRRTTKSVVASILREIRKKR